MRSLWANKKICEGKRFRQEAISTELVGMEVMELNRRCQRHAEQLFASLRDYVLALWH